MPLLNVYEILPLTVTTEVVSGSPGYQIGDPSYLIDSLPSTEFGRRSHVVNNVRATYKISVRHQAVSMKNFTLLYNVHAAYTGSWSKINFISEDLSETEIHYQEHTYGGGNDVLVDETGAWSNVIGFDFIGYRFYNRNTSVIEVSIRDIHTAAYQWHDIGFYLKGSSEIQVVPVADLDSSHKLRVYKGGTVYGIDLLSDVDDDFASDAKIRSSGVTKRLPKL